MVPSGGKKSISCPLILKSNVSFQSLDSVQAALSLDLKYYQETSVFVLFCFYFGCYLSMSRKFFTFEYFFSMLICVEFENIIDFLNATSSLFH